ncbi:MAG: prephenate dehydrogenase, partial [Chloroflexota bacterium]
MTIQISIIGLGQIGASLGLALREQKGQLLRVGNDIEHGIARQAEKLGAVDRVDVNLPNTVRNADLVILALPVDQLRETLEVIVPDLREGCVVMDTAPAKRTVMRWMEELLPQGRFYVGLTPVINPQRLADGEYGLAAARADLFKDGLMAVVAPENSEPGALKMASDLSRLVGAGPIFADPLEVDGLMAAVDLLPQLMAAALLGATVDQPGWREARKLAGQAYHQATTAIQHTANPVGLAAAAIYNKENSLRVINDAVQSLEAMRLAIEEEDHAALENYLKRLRAERDSWWNGRMSKEWQQADMPSVDMPDAGNVLGRLFGIGG